VDGVTGSPTDATRSVHDALTVWVSDDGGLYDEKSITLTVSEVNVVPVLSGMPSNVTIDEEAAYTFTATATDHDLPANTLTFSLIIGPADAGIDGTSGARTRTPTE